MELITDSPIELATDAQPTMRRARTSSDVLMKESKSSRTPSNRRTLAPSDFSSFVPQKGGSVFTSKQLSDNKDITNGNAGNARSSPSKKLQRALQVKDQCDRQLKTICESKQRRHHNFTLEGQDDLAFLDQDRGNDNVVRDKGELEWLIRKFSPASHFVSTHAEFVHLLQGCSTCSNRLAFCASCTEKSAEFFSGFTSAELFALYGSDLPPANESELASFSEAVAARETRALRNECSDT